MTAPITMGAPHKTMAIHAGSKGSSPGAKKLTASAKAETASKTMSLRVPPASMSSSTFSNVGMRTATISLYIYL